jgi:RNA polymerase sigma-70 factor, ECF subfamily
MFVLRSAGGPRMAPLSGLAAGAVLPGQAAASASSTLPDMDRAADPSADPHDALAATGEPSDEALMLRYGEGDAAAFDQLYARHRAGLYRFVLRQCPNRAQADEIFQDVWMNLINARARYQPTARFRTFLFQIARNRVIDIVRRSHAGSETSLDDDHDGAGLALVERLPADAAGEPQAIVERRDVARALRAAVAELPFAQREALLLHEEGDLSLDEIAALTGANRETVKSRLR